MPPRLQILEGGQPSHGASPRAGSELTRLALEAQGGQAFAITRLWESARVFLTRLALAFGVSYDEAPDLVQECMWAAHQALDRFDPEKGSFAAWTGTILLRLARNRFRGSKRRHHLLEAFKNYLSGRRLERMPAPDITSLEARMTLEGLLRVLTDRQRDVIALYEIAELSAKEVAAIVGISEAGVRSIARQARNKLSATARRWERIEGRNS